MTDHVHEPDCTGYRAIDDQIDAALAKYAAIEPRAGLEERVLANWRAQKKSSGRAAWWHWAVAGVAAALVVVTLVFWKLEEPARQRVVRQPSDTHQNKQPMVAVNETPKHRVPIPSRHVRRQAAPHIVTVAAEPKLDQFPSPLPLTPEELALARYVREFPEQATLIAKAQDEYERQLQQMMTSVNSETVPSSPVQEER